MSYYKLHKSRVDTTRDIIEQIRPVIKLFKILFLALLISHPPIFSQPQNEKHKINIRIGYSSMMMQDVSLTDAKAAIYVWVETLKKNILQKYNLESELFHYVYYSQTEIENALKRNEIDFMGLSTLEYYSLKDKYNLEPMLAGIVDENIYSQYILLTRFDSNINNISDLRGKIFAQAKDQYNPLINVWLYNLLKNQKITDKKNYFSKIKYEDKEVSAAYSVYFKKADCAIIQKMVYNTVCTLNPQFKNSLRILETSPNLVLVMTAMKKNTDREVVDLVNKGVETLHLTTEGESIIKLFKAKKFIGISEKDLASTKQLIDSYNLIRTRKNK
jgi:ABC-type phosphate/phosphonate transport system substrate-binding protein